jgi:hypothetical protein
MGLALGGIERLQNWWFFWGQDWDGYGRFDLRYYWGTFGTVLKSFGQGEKQAELSPLQ